MSGVAGEYGSGEMPVPFKRGFVGRKGTGGL